VIKKKYIILCIKTQSDKHESGTGLYISIYITDNYILSL